MATYTSIPSLLRRGASLMGASLSLLLLLGSCDSDQYEISGVVAGAPEGSFIALEQPDANGGWLTLDSVEIESSGKFSFSHPAPPAPEVVRLRYKGDYIYVPVDSTEHINVNSKARNFAREFNLSGSANAVRLEKFEKQVIGFAFGPYASIPDSADAFKRRVYNEFIKDANASVVSYYVLTKTIGGQPLYNPADDYKYFAAVATAFKQYRPDDPRTPLLEKVSVEGLRKHNSDQGKQKVIHAQETAIVDIVLPDATHQPVALSSVVGGGRKTVVYFPDPASDQASMDNIKLRSLREQGGVEIYEVSLDPDQYRWQQVTANLPWINVWGGDPTSVAKVTTDYNITTLPLFFIYDGTGQLVDRAESISRLEAKLKNGSRQRD